MNSSMDALWSEALGRLAGRLSPQNYDMWLRPIEYVSMAESASGDAVIHIRAPNSYVRLWFESNFLDAALSELRTLSGRDLVLVFDADAPSPEATAELLTLFAAGAVLLDALTPVTNR